MPFKEPSKAQASRRLREADERASAFVASSATADGGGHSDETAGDAAEMLTTNAPVSLSSASALASAELTSSPPPPLPPRAKGKGRGAVNIAFVIVLHLLLFVCTVIEGYL